MHHERDTEQDQELEDMLMLLQSPLGAGPDIRLRERAEAWLLAHAATAQPRLISLVEQDRGGPAVRMLLGRMGREESVAALRGALSSPHETLRWSAAQGLAAHPSGAAREALLDALAASDSRVAIAASAGLQARGDTSVCSSLSTRLRDPDSDVRSHVIQAAAKLGCIDRSGLAALRGEEQIDTVRRLIDTLIQQIDASPTP